MNWTNFNTHGQSPNHAFEVMCNIIFEEWCKAEYGDSIARISFVNGAGGDGGVEAYAILNDGRIIAVQSKWFPESIKNSQINQIERSFNTAISIRPNICRYIVCIPRDLSSSKNIKGGVSASNTEETRWLNLVDKCKKITPDVSIELWCDTRLQELLTKPSLRGVYNFWFEQSAPLDNHFELSFQKAVDSWAKDKYVPDLYAEGHIHKKMEAYLGSRVATENRYKALMQLYQSLQNLLRCYSDLLMLGIPSQETNLKDKIEADIIILREWIAYFESVILFVKEGNILAFDKHLDLNCTIDDIKGCSLHFKKYFHFNSAEKQMEIIYEQADELKSLCEVNLENRLIFLGDPGSGKTTGIVAEIRGMLSENTHLPILVHAKEYSVGDSWNSILQKALGVSSSWGENELLSSMRNISQIRSSIDKYEYGVEAKCVICVDGIDEGDWLFWKNKIEEAAAYKTTYPYLKFIFLSRPYVFEHWYESDYRQCFSLLPSYGDVMTEEVCDAYFQKYNVDIGESDWIKHLLRMPISVRLFCELYRNKYVGDLDKNTTVITELFKKKIELLEERYKKSVNGCYIPNTINNSLCEMASLFTCQESVSYDDLKLVISDQLHPQLSNILSYLSQEGFLYSRLIQKDDFEAKDSRYFWGMQPAFDYLIARKIYKEIEQGKSIAIEYTTGIYQMLSLIVAEEKGVLLDSYSNLSIEAESLFDLVCYMLANASMKTVSKFTDFAFNVMNTSVDSFRDVVNRVIIPVAAVQDHPIGAVLLDRFLNGFENSASRDIWWSIPAFLRGNYHSSWRTFSDIDFDSICLNNKDSAFTRPLVLAWSLSSVDNEIRRVARMKLIEWGLQKPLEFWDLLEHFSSVNDEQIKEDLFAVAYGVSLSKNVDEAYLKVSSSWIIDNVFSEDGLLTYENSFIRYYCKGILKLAVHKGICPENKLSITTIPFNHKLRYMPIAKEAVCAERMSGYKAIDYDLARYVLCDVLDSFMGRSYSQESCSPKAKAFIKTYSEEYQIDNIKIDGLIISMAYKYMLDNGWNESVFWTSSKEDCLGVDKAIRFTHYPSTHGAMSRVMTVAEKNTWLARHRMAAFFADVLPLRDISSGEEDKYLLDYSQLESFHNMYQEYINDKHRSLNERWFHLDHLANCEMNTFDKAKIEEWMKSDSLPDFNSWLFDNDGFILLNTFTCAKNELCGVEEAIWISSGAVKIDEFDKFVDNLNSNFEDRDELTSVVGFHTSQDIRWTCTPVEACVVYPEIETNRCFLMNLNKSSICVEKLTASCLGLDDIDTEKSFVFPSVFLREMMGITYGDGYNYYDANGNVIASYNSVGENWGTCQEILLADQKRFNSVFNDDQHKVFWIIRVYRSPSSKAYEQFDDILHDTDRTYIVWQDKNELRHIELDIISPPSRNESNIEYDDEPLNSIINRYINDEDSNTD